MAIDWDPERMSTGVQSVDEQHKTMIRLINELLEVCSTGQGRDRIPMRIRSLGHHAQHHFVHEEGVMDRFLCPARVVNKEEHAKFLEAYEKFSERLEQEGMSQSLVEELLQFVADWLVSHLCRVDCQLRSCVNRRGGS